jgi:hypothetical protein
MYPLIWMTLGGAKGTNGLFLKKSAKMNDNDFLKKLLSSKSFAQKIVSKVENAKTRKDSQAQASF